MLPRRRWFSLLTLLALLCAGWPPYPAVARADDPAITGLKGVWERTDSPQVRGNRPFVWGPQPILPIIEEPLAGLPGDQRAVLYYDKARMEVE